MIDIGNHVVHLYEHESTLSSVVAAYLASALEAGDIAVVFATAAHRSAFDAELAAIGVDIGAAIAGDRLVTVDATAAVARLARDGHIDRAAFEAEVAAPLRGLAERGQRLWAYGEMVAVLWEAGQVGAAVELEDLWNDLGRELDFALLCVYPAASVRQADDAPAFNAVGRLHTGQYEPASPPPRPETRLFASRLDAPRAARRFATLALSAWGCPHLADDAALLLTELTTNAVLHARTPFHVTLSPVGASGVRVAVADGSRVLPTPRATAPTAQSGRGLALVAAVATRWGAAPTPDGKVVCAELDR